MKCKNCNGIGIYTCNSCAGEGIDYGIHKCDTCKGEGDISCGHCGGKGKVGFTKWFKSS
ncbi:hypothetical protein [Radiobacillus sp. PE A8.2]|uniref:hypothetical protein n=1 Tax=Radiobacillus sp. PE A8.2 TaxID=3380349 RepID=UPI00388DB83A